MRRSSQAFVVVAVLLATVATAGAGVEVTPYGFVKLDASFDSAMTNNGNFVIVVLPYADGEENDEFNMTANQTRVGLKLAGGGSDAVDVSGKIEVDFYGGGAENKPSPYLRHAYLELKTDAVDILAGQGWDVISPVIPTTLNYSVLWKAGNIGYRRPQIRLTRTIKVSDDVKLKVQGSLNRTIGRDANGGETIGMPSVQGRLAVGAKLMGKSMEIGVATLMGKEEAVSAADTTAYELDQSVIAVDVSVPLGDMFSVKGQYFTGTNLATYFGGIGQGIAETPVETGRSTELVEIETSGWWAQLTIAPADGWKINLGASADDPEIPEGDTAGNKYEKNSVCYGNVLWSIAPAAVIGAEYASIETEYVGGESYSDGRMQLSFLYKF